MDNVQGQNKIIVHLR